MTLFAITFLMALGAASVVEDQFLSVRTFEWFVAFSMCGLGYLKLRDVESFSLMFLNYDLLARRWVRYSYVYPYAETGAGLLMIPAVLNWVSVPVALFIGSIGAFSVFKAVYIDKRELKCACVGGSSNVPLGFVSFTENLAMVAMALWMGVTCLLRSNTARCQLPAWDGMLTAIVIVVVSGAYPRRSSVGGVRASVRSHEGLLVASAGGALLVSALLELVDPATR